MSSVPYILPAELLAESGGVDFSGLYPESQLSPDQKLVKLCREVTDLVDDICGKYVYTSRKKYVLRATEDTESSITTDRDQVMVDKLGQLVFISNYRPVRSVTQMTYNPVAAPTQVNIIPIDYVYIDGRDIIVTGMWEYMRSQAMRITATYVNGFPNTLLTNPVSSGASTAVVDDVTGFLVGDVVEVMDDLAEGMTVTAVNAGTKTLTFAEQFAGNHAAGIRVTEIPRTVWRAAVWLCWDIAQSHTRQTLTIASLDLMGGDQIERPVNYFKRAVNLLQEHGYILTP